MSTAAPGKVSFGEFKEKTLSESSAQNVFTIRRVFWVTGSEKSPPGGETAPTMVIGHTYSYLGRHIPSLH